MDVKNNEKSELKKDDKSQYYEVVSKILTFVDKVDKNQNKKKKGDKK